MSSPPLIHEGVIALVRDNPARRWHAHVINGDWTCFILCPPYDENGASIAISFGEEWQGTWCAELDTAREAASGLADVIGQGEIIDDIEERNKFRIEFNAITEFLTELVSLVIRTLRPMNC